MKILCTGDIHIGRRPSRLPETVDCAPLSCARAWSSIVERAITEGVDLVALSGDVVDESNRYYEAVGPLESGVRKLARAGIRTVAVAGNHDHDVLPALADSLPAGDFTLLGRGGRWERKTIDLDGTARLHVDGWSFPQGRHREDPLRGFARRDPDGVPALGLLHADLDQPASPYAPVRLADLRRHPVGFWLLGHVHAARLDSQGGAPVLYPGSPQAMDPGETGPHGVWLVEVDGSGRFEARHLPLATVRYETATVDVGGAAEEGELGRRIRDAVARELGQAVDRGAGPLRYLSLRLRLTGRTPLHRDLARMAAPVVEDLRMEEGAVTALVEKVEIATRPARDLEGLAGAQDAPGVLARLVLSLQSGADDPASERLLREALRAAADVRSGRAYGALPQDEVELAPGDGTRILAEQAMELLDALLAQKEVA